MFELHFQDTNRYEYALIQYCPLKTFEVLNIGVIVKNNETLRYKKIPSIAELSHCFYIDEIEGLEFAIEAMSYEIDTHKLFKAHDVSNTLRITTPAFYTSALGIDDVTEHLFSTMLSSKGIHKPKRNTNDKDINHVIKKLSNVAHEKNYKALKFRQNIENAHKRVDAVTFIDKSPIVAMEISSPYASDFMQNFAVANIILQSLSQNKSIKERVMYIPILESMNKALLSNYQSAKHISKNVNGFHFLDTCDYSEVIGYLQTLTQKYH